MTKRLIEPSPLDDLEQLCRLHDVGLDPLAPGDDPAGLPDRILGELERRLADLPGDPEALRGLRALVGLFTRATALKAQAEAAAALRERSAEVERVNARLEAALAEARAAREGNRGIEERDRLEKLGEIMGALAVLCHKINNPLTALLGRAQILRLGAGTEPKVVKAATVIEESATRIADLVHELAVVVKEGRREAIVRFADAEGPGVRREAEE